MVTKITKKILTFQYLKTFRTYYNTFRIYYGTHFNRKKMNIPIDHTMIDFLN